MDPSQQNMYYNSWWNNHPSNNWHMDPHKTGLNQPPPAHNVSAPSQYPPPQGIPIAQVIPSGYNLPKPAHTGSSMVKTTQGQGLQSGAPAKPVSNMPEKSYPMMPPKSTTPPNHSPSVSSKVGFMPQTQQPYQQFQQRLNTPQLHLQAQTAQQNLPMHTNQSHVNTHSMPPYQQAQSQKVQLSNQSVPMNKQEPPKGPTPPIPDLISITKPAASQPLPPSQVKSDMPQCQQTSVKTPQNVSPVVKEAQKTFPTSEMPYVPQTVQLGSESKPLNSPTVIGKVAQALPKIEINKSITPSDAGNIYKKPDGIETKVSQEQSVSDKGDRSASIFGGVNHNGVPPKPQLKTTPTAAFKSTELSDSKTVGQKMPTKNVTIPSPKISPTSIVSSTKPQVTPPKPAVPAPSKSSQPIMKPVVTPPKTIVAQATLQHIPASVQGSAKSGATTASKPNVPTVNASALAQNVIQADGQSNIKGLDTTKMDPNIAQSNKALGVDHPTQELKPEAVAAKSVKAGNVSPKLVKGDILPTKPEPVILKASKPEISPAKSSEAESLPTKGAKEDNLPSKVPKETSAPAKSSIKKVATPKITKERAPEKKKPERSTRTEAVPKTPVEGERKSKRTRTPAPIYQSPAIEAAIRIPKSLALIPPAEQEKLICFFKNEHIAVRNPDGAFYICQLAQNVSRSSKKLKIRWLSPTEETDTCENFKPDYYDMTDFDCILTSVRLEKVDRTTFRLPLVERERIMSILHRALDKEKGINTSRDDLAEDHPDGLDISLYKDETQLKQKTSKKSSRGKRAPSEDTTDEDSEEMKDLGDESEESEVDKNDSESESEEVSTPPPKVRKNTARKTPAGGRRKTPAKREPEPVATPAPRASSSRNKRSAATAAISESSTATPPAKAARTLRQTTKTPAKQSKPTPKITRRTKK